jgi:hypothetical protein
MRPDKANIHLPGRKNNNSNQPVIIPFYIKHKAIIPDAIDIPECLSHIGKATPLAFPCTLVPVSERSIRIRMQFGIFLNTLKCYNSHAITILAQR